MNQKLEFISPDDLFVLGNLAGLAVHNRSKQSIGSILKLLQLSEPSNAAGYTLEAKKLADGGDVELAISKLENSPAFEATDNRDIAIVLHLLLLQMDRQFERALDLAYAYRSEGILTEEKYNGLIEKSIEDIEFILSHFKDENMEEGELQCL